MKLIKTTKQKKAIIDTVDLLSDPPKSIVALPPGKLFIDSFETRDLTVQNPSWSVRFVGTDGTDYTLHEVAKILRSISYDLEERAELGKRGVA